MRENNLAAFGGILRDVFVADPANWRKRMGEYRILDIL
jgi:hypothetical protein